MLFQDAIKKQQNETAKKFEIQPFFRAIKV